MRKNSQGLGFSPQGATSIADSRNVHIKHSEENGFFVSDNVFMNDVFCVKNGNFTGSKIIRIISLKNVIIQGIRNLQVQHDEIRISFYEVAVRKSSDSLFLKNINKYLKYLLLLLLLIRLLFFSSSLLSQESQETRCLHV